MPNSLKPFQFQSLLLILLGVLQSCSNSPSRTNKSSSYVQSVSLKPNLEFTKFLKKFKALSFPLTIESLKIRVDSSRKLNSKDNIFIKSQYPDEIYAYGMLSDTSDTFKIIWLQPAEMEVPVLTIFTKSGKKISEEYLGVGQCGSDCGFSCNEIIKLGKDLSIFSADSIQYNNCDTNGNETGNIKKYVLYKTGRILNSGKITMSNVLKRPIK
jgi:hypothetical protein